MARPARPIVKHPAALRDLAALADYLAGASNLALAERFLAAAERTLSRLARSPGLGSRWDSDHPRLADLRVAPIAGFRNHLLFYRPIADGIELVRVLHGARDLDGLLDAELPDPDAGCHWLLATSASQAAPRVQPPSPAPPPGV